MPEFWESAYSNNERMWGEDPTNNALEVLDLFRKMGIQNMLIPGFGYGRNARPFHDAGIEVTGIEISETAIKRARKHFGSELTIHQGSVTEMPFDEKQFEGVYCFSLIHLLDKAERKKLIRDCYLQLAPGGIMVFVALTINDVRYGQGEEVERNSFLSPHGLKLYFYDESSIQDEFGDYNIIDLKEINEPMDQPTEKHWMVVCEKT